MYAELQQMYWLHATGSLCPVRVLCWLHDRLHAVFDDKLYRASMHHTTNSSHTELKELRVQNKVVQIRGSSPAVVPHLLEAKGKGLECVATLLYDQKNM